MLDGEACSGIARPDLAVWPRTSHAWWLQWRSIWLAIAYQYDHDSRVGKRYELMDELAYQDQVERDQAAREEYESC